MNVIKAILPEHYNFDFGKPEIDEVVKRLQMWEVFKGKYGEMVGLHSYEAPVNIGGNLKELMEEFEQGYFPKEDQMIKIYYEGAWKELKETLPKLDELYHNMARCVLASIKDKMNDLEQKHTQHINP